MSQLIPAGKRARKTWLAGLSPYLTASNAGAAFLSAQITDLEQRCAAMRSRINHKRSRKKNAREVSATRMSVPVTLKRNQICN